METNKLIKNNKGHMKYKLCEDHWEQEVRESLNKEIGKQEGSKWEIFQQINSHMDLIEIREKR